EERDRYHRSRTEPEHQVKAIAKPEGRHTSQPRGTKRNGGENYRRELYQGARHRGFSARQLSSNPLTSNHQA
ncbi:MAG TPA: hypothetical protein VMH05_08200, partial [Bryobacteraceae bacterium]|nr:hypothetical protein [Bryobacteraceae bacterium]